MTGVKWFAFPAHGCAYGVDPEAPRFVFVRTELARRPGTPRRYECEEKACEVDFHRIDEALARDIRVAVGAFLVAEELGISSMKGK